MEREGRTIFHVDVNSAFLSWSALKQLEEDPNAVDLRTIPSAVGGDVKTRHGVITAKSIPAKKYGTLRHTGSIPMLLSRSSPGIRPSYSRSPLMRPIWMSQTAFRMGTGKLLWRWRSRSGIM